LRECIPAIDGTNRGSQKLASARNSNPDSPNARQIARIGTCRNHRRK
jgi:hypothetical protein